MAKRRAGGKGNLRKRKDDRWEGQHTADRDLEMGRAIYKNVLGKTQVEARTKLKQAIEKTRGLDAAEVGRYTMSQRVEIWFEHYTRMKVRPFSHRTYRGHIDNHTKPNIGKIPLEKLTSPELQKFYKKLLEKGRMDRLESKHQSKGLSAKTVRNTHRIISSAVKLAQEQKLISTNPADGYALPRLEHREVQTLPVEQLQSFLRETRDGGVLELYYLELATGLRRGESLGLKWEGTDLEWGDLRVWRQIARINGKVVEALLKAKDAYRILPLAEDTIGVLEAQRRKTGNSQRAFPSTMGGLISPDSILHVLRRMLKRAGSPRTRSHNLRHTLVTLALQNGVDVKMISEMLGHLSTGFTLNTYAHVTTASQCQTTKTMGDILSGGLQP